MPIRPENMAKYPGGSIRSPEWRAIRERIQYRAGDHCEACGVPNRTYGYRSADGVYHYLSHVRADAEATYLERVCMTTEAEVGHLIRIVCTVAHVDGGLDDHSDDNLRFWCQRCHLRHDKAQHARSRKERLYANSLFD